MSVALRVREVELLMLTKHLSTMVRAGIPLSEALATLEETARSKSGQKVFAGVREEVEGGAKLAEAMAKYHQVFDRQYLAVIRIAEESGTLEESLAYLVEQRTKSYRLRQKVRGAMMYPMLVIAAVILIGGAIAYFVLPQLVDFFALLDVELPISTRVLIGIGEMMQRWGLLIGLLVLMLVVGMFLLWRVEKVRGRWQQIILKMPLVGKLVLEAQVATLARSLGVMVQNGVPIMQAMKATTETTSYLPLRVELMKVASEVEGGASMGKSMGKYAPSYPILVARMITIGEKTGKIDESLLYLAEFYEEEVEDRAKNLASVLEPALLILIGLVVAAVALAVISPIYQLTGSIR